MDWKPQWFQGFETHIRPLAYLNHANMGDYGQAIAGYQQGVNKVPDITLYRHQDSLKQGFGLNLEQELPPISALLCVPDGMRVIKSHSPIRK